MRIKLESEFLNLTNKKKKNQKYIFKKHSSWQFPIKELQTDDF